jgi:hypothetical protein
LHLINLNSYRNIYFKNDRSNINYLNYNNFIYDFDEIEEELGKIILDGKRLFSDNIKFIEYTDESFRKMKNSTLEEFNKSYKPEKMTNDERTRFFKYLIGKNIDFKEIISSIQQIVHYLLINKKEIDSTINDILSENLNRITDDCKDLFEDLQELEISKLFDLYFYIELLYYDSIVHNDDNDKKIDEENKKIVDGQKPIIEEYFGNNKKKIIDKVDLACFCRRLISRYDNDTKTKNNKLFLYFDKVDLWSLEVILDDSFKKEIPEIKKIIGDIEFNQNQVLYLVEFLDPKNINLMEYKQMIEEEEEKQRKNIARKNNNKKLKKKNNKK